MIKRLKIKNFQCHENLDLEFDEGINIISGASDRGKSSVIRALDLVRYNSPTGFSYRYDPRILKRSKKALKDSELTAIEVTLDSGSVIARERNKREINQYRINDIVLQAMRSGVPDEVRSLLNIANYSVQPQHNPYFLLNDSDGEVSRQINELVGLESINIVLKKASSIVDDAKAKAKEASEKAEAISFSLERLKDLAVIEKRFEKLQKKTKVCEDLSSSIEDLTDLIDHIYELNSKLDFYYVYLINEEKVIALDEKISRLNTLESSTSALESLINDLSESLSESEYCENLTHYEKRVNSLNSKIEEYSSFLELSSELEDLIDWLYDSETSLENAVVDIETYTKNYIQTLKKAKRCPTCGSDINEKNIGKVL